MSLTKSEIVDSICDEYLISRKEAKNIVDDIFEQIRSSLEKGEDVKITNFGHFDLREKTERPGRNPKTGEEVSVSARRVVTFKAGQTLKDKISKASENKGAEESLQPKEVFESI